MKGLGKVLYEYLQDVQSLLAPGIAAVFLLGVLSKRTTAAAGYTGLITGFVLGMTRLLLKVFAGALNPDSVIYSVFIAPNWLHYEIALFVIVIVTMVVVSFFTEKPNLASIQGLYLGSATAEQKRITRESWNNWDLINSGIVIAVVIAFYAYFW